MEDVAEELSRVPYLSPAEFHNLLGSGREYTIIDTRKVHTVNDTLTTTLYKTRYSEFLPFSICVALHDYLYEVL